MSSWQDLTMTAMDMLRRPHDGLGFGTAVLLQILCRTPINEPRCWCISGPIHEQDSSPEYVVTLHTWLSQTDYPDVEAIEDETGFVANTPEFKQVFRDRVPMKPTIETTRFSVNREAVRHHLSQISTLSVSAVIQSDLPNDGCSYEASVGNYVSGVTYRWWGEGPKEWTLLTRSVHHILSALEKSLDSGRL